MATLSVLINADCRINPNEGNYGSDTSNWLQTSSPSRILNAADFSSLPGGVVIDEAILQFRLATGVWGGKGKTLDALRLTRTNWTEKGAIWSKYDGTNNWTSAGGDYTATDKASTTIPGSSGYIQWDVTDQVLYAQQNTSKVLHFLIKFASESGSYDCYLSSRESATEAYRPKLTLTFRYLNGLWFGNA